MVTDEDCDKNTPLLLAIESGNEQVVEKLISYGSNVNHINKVYRHPAIVGAPLSFLHKKVFAMTYTK